MEGWLTEVGITKLLVKLNLSQFLNAPFLINLDERFVVFGFPAHSLTYKQDIIVSSAPIW
jgi:hypothetical protein